MKHKELIDQMTLEEKAAFLSGKSVWETREIKHLGIPSVFLSDGPHGVRKQAGAGDHLGLNASLEATCICFLISTKLLAEAAMAATPEPGKLILDVEQNLYTISGFPARLHSAKISTRLSWSIS